MLLLSSADSFQNYLFQKIISGTISVSNYFDPDQDRRTVGPDWVRTVFKGYQQTTNVAASKGRVYVKGMPR